METISKIEIAWCRRLPPAIFICLTIEDSNSNTSRVFQKRLDLRSTRLQQRDCYDMNTYLFGAFYTYLID